ncbi:ABC transporter permease [Sphingomonas sp.]|uniref:ABC transporter permease n=1 Tax=Sphingomonas sp. TaxID=28214 RepID=UPI001D414627|nr:ABC transporter permease [Sphingomonas sp.]MBX9797011.1 ABC transporter permease [Sphingomonas sp.]
MTSNRQRLIRQTLTIARRDFTATVFTPLFLLFLLSPLIMVAFGSLGALGGATFAAGAEGKARLIAIAAPADQAGLRAADERMRRIFRRGDAPPPLIIEAPGADPAAQARAAFDRKDYDATAVLHGALDHPDILYSSTGTRAADYLAALAEATLDSRARRGTTLSQARKQPFTRTTITRSGQNQTAFLAVGGIFFLTLFLSGQSVSVMTEERSNKVIEILAAAVPLEAVFLGKLIGMFGVAVLFVLFWGTLVSQIGHFIPGGGARVLAEIGPAVGLPMFVVLFFSYFTMAYMLLGAVFLSIGAQAQTMREVQLLSLPITILQMAMFGLASAAAGDPGSTIAHIAEIFPLSSPFAMVARAANSAPLWPHALALAWQALWVAVTIWVGAGAFRRGVLKSGGGPGGLFARRMATTPIDNNVN